MKMSSHPFTEKFPVLYIFTDDYGHKVGDTCDEHKAKKIFEAIKDYKTVESMPWKLQRALVMAI